MASWPSIARFIDTSPLAAIAYPDLNSRLTRALLPRQLHLFYFVDVWYYIPFVRFLVNSVVVSLIAVVANVVFNAMGGYALTLPFRGKRAVVLALLAFMMIPFQATIIPAYLITKELGLLNTHLGLALPLCSTIVGIFVFKAAFDAVPRSLIDAARLDGLGDGQILRLIMLPLSTSAVATNVILSFIWSWNSFLWPLIIVRNQEMQTLPLGLHHGPAPRRADLRPRPAAVHRRADLGGHQGVSEARRWLLNRYVVVFGTIAAVTLAWNLYVATHDDGRIAGVVVGPDGRPVAGATVTLRERTLTTLEPRATVRTGERGEFLLTGQRVYHFVLEAQKEGVGAAPRTAFRLYFRGQNFTLPAPLRLEG